MPHTKRAFNWMEEHIDIFKKLEPKSFLYVGHRVTKRWWHEKFCAELGVERKGLVEIFPDNIAIAKMELKDDNIEIIQNDVRCIDKFAVEGEWDIVFWDHGPEHCDEEDLDPATTILKQYVGKALIYCCPWGRWPQGILYENEWERHRTSVQPEMFERNGMTTVTTGEETVAGEGELIGYWVKEND